ncbi:glycoside hydrolase family 3 N-terminal domain-containing protein [Thomasclavelia saccharogumia]|uniref:glycoside hydrolase family 3 N-terminal domain-containing protein n=1 Tax=Thomasclavelia saccharogumia TaxID=341225 RepID=UPI00068D2316|nr:glycoside hydrolase family 3 N-terminal domain-containing protein [Thomasclavelia saccharogumia]
MKKGKILASILSLTMILSIVVPVNAASSRVEELLAKMTLRQKVTQMLMVDFRYWDTDLSDGEQTTGNEFTKMNSQVQKVVEDYDFGAVIYFAQNIVETQQSFELSQALQEAATKDGGIPLIISADQEGGSVYRLGSGTALPGNMALGATGSVEYAQAAGEIIGSELSVLGINTNLAPVVDVNNNANNPVIGLRSYSDDAELVGTLASATIKGLADYNVIGCAKHFPGHGDTATDSHYGLPVVDKSKEELMENELKPYEVAIDQGIEMIMTAHILYPQLDDTKIYSNKTGQEESLPATMSKKILTDLLKGEMGFEGIVCTDAMNMAGVSAIYDQVQAVKVAIAAGVDMICMPCTLYNLDDLKDLDAIIDGVVAAVESGEIPESRLDDAVTRILTVKENRGILDYDANDYSLDKALATVGSDANRELEREIAAAAVTVIKNENDILPLSITENSKVLMLCPYNNEKAQMVMAWNRAKEAGLVPDGAECKVYRFANATINDELQELLDWADTVIINSEVSSAARMAYDHWLSAAPNNYVNYCHENNKTSIIMSVDKPYDVQLYPNADAILAVYGCKGSSVDVTEALVGGITSDKAAYGPNIIAGIEVALGTFGASGKLPVNIPEFDNSNNTYTDNIVYPRGYGLTYDSLLDKEEINKKSLSIAVEMANNVTEEQLAAVVPVVVDEFKAALQEATLILADDSVDQATVDASFTRLSKVMQMLEFVKGDKSELEALISSTENYVKENYTADSWAAYESALETAKEVVANENALQEDVDEAYNNLQTMIEGLVKVIKVDKTALQIAVEMANELKEQGALDNVIPVVVTEFNEALAEAEIVLADPNADQTTVNTSFYRLAEAMHMLEFVKGDKTALNELIEEAEKYQEDNFTADSWAGLQEALEAAKEVAADENALEADVVEALNNLKDAMNNLVIKVDKTKLQEAYDMVNNLDKSPYTEGSVANLAKPMANAKAVLDDAEATQAEVDAAYKTLIEAYLDLRLIPNKDLLQGLINKAETLSAVNYSAKTWNVLADALEEAKAVLDDPEATQEEVDNAKDVLAKAMAGLEEVKTSNSVKAGDTTASIKTGDDSMIGVFAGVGLLSMAAALVSYRRKED